MQTWFINVSITIDAQQPNKRRRIVAFYFYILPQKLVQYANDNNTTNQIKGLSEKLLTCEWTEDKAKKNEEFLKVLQYHEIIS